MTKLQDLKEVIYYLNFLEENGYANVTMKDAHVLPAILSALDSLNIQYTLDKDSEGKDYYDRPVFHHVIWLK